MKPSCHRSQTTERLQCTPQWCSELRASPSINLLLISWERIEELGQAALRAPRHEHAAEGICVVFDEFPEGLLRVGPCADVAGIAGVLFGEILEHVFLLVEVGHHHRTRRQPAVGVDDQEIPARLRRSSFARLLAPAGARNPELELPSLAVRRGL